MSALANFSPSALDDIRQREPVSTVFERLGVRLRKAGRMFVCICPFHSEKTASCQIDDGKGFFHCKGCATGGDVFDAVQGIKSCSFPEAVEWLGGVRELAPEDLARIEQRNKERAEQAFADAKRTADMLARTMREALPWKGTAVQSYLEARGVNPHPLADLRFHPSLVYWGFPDEESDKGVELGRYPTMLGAIRADDGTLIGVHRTYLDPAGDAKLKPPGCQRRNRAKKIVGEQMGGSIALSPRAPRMAYGEGIETTLSWRSLMGEAARGYGLAALVSLGNISGSSDQHVAHPTKRHPDGRPVKIPSGTPNMEKPGFVPHVDVLEAVLLGDGDSDAAGTRASLLTAARRWRDTPRDEPLTVNVSMAPDGSDFNDLLIAMADEL